MSNGAVVASAREHAVVDGMPCQGCREGLATPHDRCVMLTSDRILVALQRIKFFECPDIKQADHSFASSGSDEIAIGTPPCRIDHSSM